MIIVILNMCELTHKNAHMEMKITTRSTDIQLNVQDWVKVECFEPFRTHPAL